MEEEKVIVKKRPMRRRQERAKQELEKNWGVSYRKRVARLSRTIYKRNDRIKVLLGRIERLKEDYGKLEHRLGILHRREIRKLETKLRNLQNKFDDFKERKGQRNRTVIYRKKYTHYEPTAKIKSFEKYCLGIKDETEELYITHFERFMKVYEYLKRYNEENDAELTLNHYLILLYLLFAKTGLGVTAPKVTIPTLSPHTVRKSLNYLVELSLADKNKLRFRITLLGEAFLKDVKNLNSFGKSEIIELAKRYSGLDK